MLVQGIKEVSAGSDTEGKKMLLLVESGVEFTRSPVDEGVI